MIIKGYKGFDKDLKCRDFQYEVGKGYSQEESVRICEKGFHFCENPFDVFEYYGPRNSRYCKVVGFGDVHLDRAKVAASKIYIYQELTLQELVEEGIKLMLEHNKSSIARKSGNISVAAKEHANSISKNEGYRSIAANTGEYSIALNEGYHSIAAATAYRSVATASGYHSAAINTGAASVAINSEDYSLAINSGACSVAINSGPRSMAIGTFENSIAVNNGKYSVAENKGNNSVAQNNGDCSVAVNYGDCSIVKIIGEDGIAIATGANSVASGAIGCYLVLTERDDNCHVVDMKCVKVDGKTIKPDTYYMLKNGKIIERKPAF